VKKGEEGGKGKGGKGKGKGRGGEVKGGKGTGQPQIFWPRTVPELNRPVTLRGGSITTAKRELYCVSHWPHFRIPFQIPLLCASFWSSFQSAQKFAI